MQPIYSALCVEINPRYIVHLIFLLVLCNLSFIDWNVSFFVHIFEAHIGQHVTRVVSCQSVSPRQFKGLTSARPRGQGKTKIKSTVTRSNSYQSISSFV